MYIRHNVALCVTATRTFTSASRARGIRSDSACGHSRFLHHINAQDEMEGMAANDNVVSEGVI